MSGLNKTDKELLQQALNALEKISMGGSPDWADDVIPVIRTRLAQPDADAVAWINPVTLQDLKDGIEGVHLVYEVEMVNSIPLFEYPPKKEWLGLTDDDVNYFVDAIYKGFDMKPRNEVEIAYFERLIKSIDRKLKDKNAA
jgi:hypothetical protein